MRLKNFKTFNGELAVYTADFRLNTRRSQRVIAFISGAALMGAIWFGASVVHAATSEQLFTKAQMVDYTVLYLNHLK